MMDDRFVSNISEELYKIAYVNHPMTIWTRSHIENYKYVRDLWHYLCIEYSLRYEKVHSCEKLDYEFFSDPYKDDLGLAHSP